MAAVYQTRWRRIAGIDFTSVRACPARVGVGVAFEFVC